MKRAHPPGPSSPALVQSWQWMRNPPLGLLERHHRRYGDVFQLEILGPCYRRDRTPWPLARRTVVVFSAPEHVQEIFSQSNDAFRAGEAQEFLEWFLGPRSLMVLEGAAHREEKHELLSLFTPDRIEGFERVLQRAAVRALDTWPVERRADLGPLIDLAFEEMNRELVFGGQQIDQRKLELTRRARSAFSSPLLFVPMLRADLGTWSAGGIVAEIRRGVRQVVFERLRNQAVPAAESEPSLLTLLVQLQENGTNGDGLDLLVDRTLTLLGGLDNAAAAVLWTCSHLIRNPEVLARARDEVRGLPETAVAGPDSYLEAVCKESLRLHPVFPVVVRRTARQVSLAGFDLAPDTFVMASMYLLHRRADLYPEPEAFKPERFVGRTPRSGTYAPFGAGVRRCLGSALASRQMRVLLTEVLRRFDLTAAPLGPLTEARRNVTVVPAGSLPVVLRPADAPAEPKPLPDPPHSAPVQTLIALWGSLERADRFARRQGDIFQVRLLMARQPGDRSRWPVVAGTAVLVSSPELLREVFTTTAPALAGGEARDFTRWFFGSKSLLVLDGEAHLQERRALLSLFTPDLLSRSEAVMREVAADAFARLPEAGDVELAPLLDEAILAISVRLMFGPVDQSTGRRLRKCVLDGLTSMGWSAPLLLFPWLQRDLGPWSPGGRAARVLREFREILAEQVSRCRSGEASTDNWLAQILRLEGAAADDAATVDRRVSRTLTILFGTETVAVALRWCLFHLLRNPAELARAKHAARSSEWTYLDAVCKETARIHPAIPILSRRVMETTSLGGYRLERGTYLVGSIYQTHRRPDLYPEPDRFRPERFLERSFSPYEFVPFGGGVRRCLGQGLGFRQMSIVLAQLLGTFDLEPRRLPRLRVRRRAVMMLPTDPLRVGLRRS